VEERATKDLRSYTLDTVASRAYIALAPRREEEVMGKSVGAAALIVAVAATIGLWPAASTAVPGLTGAYYLPSSRSYHIDDDGLPVPTKDSDATRIDAQIAFGAGKGFVREGREQLVWWVPERDRQVAAIWKGFVRLPKAGTYYFATVSDDASSVYLNQSRVALNGGLGYYIASDAFRYPDANPAPHPSRHTYIVPVAVDGPRVLPIEVRYVGRNASSNHGFGIDLYWVTPDAKRDQAGKPIAELVPAAALFTEPPEPIVRPVVSRAHSTISSDFLYFPFDGVATLTVRLADERGRPVPGRRVHISGLTSYGEADAITQPQKPTDENGTTTAKVQAQSTRHVSTFFATDITDFVDVGQTAEIIMAPQKLSFLPPAFSPYYDGKHFKVTPTPVRVGQPTTVSVPLTNRQKSGAQLNVRLLQNPQNIGLRDWTKIAESETFTLAPGETKTVELTWTPTEALAHLCFKVEVWGELQRAGIDGPWFALGRAYAADPQPKERVATIRGAGAPRDGVLINSRQQNIGPIQCDVPKATPKPSATPSQGPSRKGFVFAKGGGSVLRDKPSPNAKPLWTPPPSYRLVYTDVVYDKSGKAEWYHVPKGYGNPHPGWISADHVLTKRSTAPPPGRALDLKGTGLGLERNDADVGCGFRG
jgi:hypothetical protein